MQKCPQYPDRVDSLAHPALLCSPYSHLSDLKRVVDVKRGILRAGPVLDHSWVLRVETWGSAGTWPLCGNSEGASSKSPVAPRTARWGQRCCPNICSKSFTPHCHYQPFTGAGPAPQGAYWSGVAVTLTWRPFHGSNVTRGNKSYRILQNQESTQLPKGGRRKSPEMGCQPRWSRRTGFHRLCFEPYLQLRPKPPPALHAPAAAVAAAAALRLHSAPFGPPRFSKHGLAIPAGRVTRIPAAAADCACVWAKGKAGSGPT